MTGGVERVPDEELDYDEDLVYLYAGKRFTGIGFDEAPGVGRSEISYVDGWQEGAARDWYPSGKIKAEYMYHKSSRNGLSREFREDGTLISEEQYVASLLVHAVYFDGDGVATEEFDLPRSDPSYPAVYGLDDGSSQME
jgi:antitoxin component YwqK of YwqJK toxin-antitoxin module